MKICICLNVSDGLIREQARAGIPLETVLRTTRAGSGCGNCLLAIARLHAAEFRGAAAPVPVAAAAPAPHACQGARDAA